RFLVSPLLFQMAVTEDIIDVALLTAFSYLLLRLQFAKHEAFRTHFFHWFLLIGLFSSFSVIGYIIAVRFTYSEEYSWVFKAGYLLNAFTVTAATIGKVYMLAHRLTVLRSISLNENVWTRSFSAKLVLGQIILSGVQCGQIFFCDYAYTERNGVKYVTYFDDKCTDKTKRLLITKQREMFIVVSVCSITHLIKAIHQMCWVLVAAFQLQDLGTWLQYTYPYTHYLSTYSGAITLVIFNSRVRWLLISIKYEDREEGTTRVTSLSRF
ncbi:hypothetical protein PENTCL1PPCAC_11849, partial [Pristionchus entomophagus]